MITFLETFYQFWLRLSTAIVWDIVLRESLLFPSLDVWILSEKAGGVNWRHVAFFFIFMHVDEHYFAISV